MRIVVRVAILLSMFVGGVSVGMLVGNENHESWKADMHMQLRDFATGVGSILHQMAKDGATDDIQTMSKEMPGELLKVYVTGDRNPAWLTSWFERVKRNH